MQYLGIEPVWVLALGSGSAQRQLVVQVVVATAVKARRQCSVLQ